MRLSIAPIMLLALACGCGGESGLEKLQGTWVEVPVPRSWYETSVTEEQHRGYLAKFAAREPEILVFKNNTLTSLTGDSVVSRKFEVLEEREASGLRLQFVIEHDLGPAKPLEAAAAVDMPHPALKWTTRPMVR